MRRLPTFLQPAWPLLKRAHVNGARALGAVSRRLPVAGERQLPRTGTQSAACTAALEPGSVKLWPAGPSETIIRELPQGAPAEHWVFRDQLHHEVPARFVLELRDGIVVGTEAATVTAGGVLDYETSAYFATTSWTQQPLFLKPRLPPIERVPGSLLSMATRGTNYNYYHFLLDAIPTWGTLQDAMPGVEPDALYVNTHTRYHKQLLALAGLDHLPVVEPRAGHAVRAERLLVPSMPNSHTVAPRWAIEWIRARLRPGDLADKPKRVYLTRGHTRYTRCVVEEQKLTDRLTRQGFVVIDPGRHDVQEQIDIFAAAEVIVAPHGAGLVNVAFSRPGVRVLEMFAPRYVHRGCWTVVDAIPDSRYRYLVGKGRAPRPGGAMSGNYDDIAVDPGQVETMLEELLQA